ncbi:MAG: S1 family peptidase [Bacillota bacterium]
MALTWKVSGQSLPTKVGHAVVKFIYDVAREQKRDLADLFPFRGPGWLLKHTSGSNWFCFSIADLPTGQCPVCDKMPPEESASIGRAVESFTGQGYSWAKAVLGAESMSFDRFTYVGPWDGDCLSWQHVRQFIVDWLNDQVLAVTEEVNRQRVLRAIPQPPAFNVQDALDSLVVLECEETCRQGTGFLLEEYGYVTCYHTLGARTSAYTPTSLSKSFPITVVSYDQRVDLAVFRVEGDLHRKALPVGSADAVSLMDHLLVLGFPNYRRGDSGVAQPGMVVGFRPVSGIRRLLTNAGIVAGMSGGPALGRGNRVVGIAATGADTMQNTTLTEDQSIIPVDALGFLVHES